jgi:tetratricopeptide (TPR) repeat protein
MVSMKKYYLTSIFLCVVFILGNKVQAQSFIQKADSCFALRNYDMAQLYYSRAAFEEREANIQALLLFKKAEALLYENNKDQAFKTCNGISLTELNDSVRLEVLYKSALYAFFNQDLLETKSKLNLLEEIYPEKKNESRVKILNVLMLNESGKYESAREKLLDYIAKDVSKNEDEKLALLKQADSVYLGKKVPKIINKTRAMGLNAMTLGFGFFYSKNYLEGISSFVIQTLGLSLSAISIINGYYFTGIIAPLTVYNYFHTGSVKRVEYLVEKANYKKMYQFNTQCKNKIIDLLK